MSAPPIYAIVGPTGSGKTALALDLAERLGTEILSADSMQFYRGMEIGTAAPTPEERARVPHHFVAMLDPSETMSAGAYAAQAGAVLDRLQRDGRAAVVVGGSGLYVNALLDGIFEGPGRDPAVRAQLEAEAEALGNDALFARLQQVDPDYAARLTSANDRVRIVRALEVYEIAGRPFSVLHAEHRAQHPPRPARRIAYAWPRAELYGRLDRRVLAMIDAGWIDEVRALLDAGHGPQLQRLKALGYRELAAYLAGEQSLDAAIAATQMHHRRYAKRQLTWFRADPRVEWITPGRGVAELGLCGV